VILGGNAFLYIHLLFKAFSSRPIGQPTIGHCTIPFFKRVHTIPFICQTSPTRLIPIAEDLDLIQSLKETPVLAELLALTGAATYALHSWVHAHGQASVIDEGLYLYKGLLYASGIYRPFQDFGPWTNHMPLSFLIPGWVQLAFGPGIRTGRYFSIALGLLMLLGLWIISRRIGGKWLAAAAVWIIALSPGLVKMYSQAISQVLIAAMLMWVLVLVIGEDRPTWQLAAGAGLAGVMALTRINLLVVLPLLVFYIGWEYDRRQAFLAAAVGATVVAVGHALFWPGILKLWAYWLPAGPTPFLDSWREAPGAIRFWDPSIGLGGRLDSLTSGLQRHMIPLMGLLATWLAWPRRGADTPYRRTAIFLVALLLVLLLVHGAASLGLSYCVYCFQMYLAFFAPLGVILLVLVLAHLLPPLSSIRKLTVLLVLLAVSVFLAQHQYGHLGTDTLSTQAPRVKELRILPGSVDVSVLLANKFGTSYSQLALALNIALLAWTVLTLAILIALFTFLLFRRGRAKLPSWPIPSLSVLVSIWLLWLTVAFGNNFINYNCGGDVIGSYEQVGTHLAKTIPARSSVYWAGGLTPVPLLYLPAAEVFPAQLNQDYSFRIGGEPSGLERFGFWNRELASRWLADADYVLIEQSRYRGWLAESVAASRLQELEPTPPTVPCRTDAVIRIFRSQK